MCTCQKCGEKYKIDFIVHDDIWKTIRDDGEKVYNLLCPVCISKAIVGMDEGYYAFHIYQIDCPTCEPKDSAPKERR